MRAPSRSVAVAMVPAGTIAGHALGYLMAGEDTALSGTHSHLNPAAWIAAAVVAATLASIAVCRPPQGPGRRGLHLSWLVSGQVVLFALLEGAEHLRSGHGALSFVTDPSFRWGVAAQLVSAAVLVTAAAVARTSGERVRAFLSRRAGGRPSPVRRRWCDVDTVVPTTSWSSAVSERGPPRRLAPA